MFKNIVLYGNSSAPSRCYFLSHHLLCALIINKKIEELQSQGKDKKNTILDEGLAEKEYENYNKKLNSRLKKVNKTA